MKKLCFVIVFLLNLLFISCENIDYSKVKVQTCEWNHELYSKIKN